MAMQTATVSSTMGPPSALHNSSSTSDIGNLVGDSFSDVPSDDSGSWMNRVDVSNFRQLCAPPPATPATVLALDHGGYAVTASYPSPDSGESPPSKKDRSSFGSVDTPRDFGAELAAAAENAAAQVPMTVLPTSLGVVTSSGKSWVKPTFSYSCLIALALKNSKSGRLTVAEIYNFMCENFPYFRNAPAGWKNSVRHNLSLNKCFEKIEVETPGGHGRKVSCLWTMNPAKVAKMENEVRKCRDKDPNGVVESLANPDEMELLEKGLKGMPGECNSFYISGLPDVAPANQMLLLRPANGGGSYAFGQNFQTQQSSGWATGASPVPPKTPPRPQLASPAQQHFSTPTQARRTPSAQPQQSSPFAHTPPYSPTVHSPRHRPDPQAPHWSSTPQNTLALHSPYSSGYASSDPSLAAFGACSPCRLTPYDTAANALNNNSLLQSALGTSPCRLPPQALLTLHSL